MVLVDTLFSEQDTHRPQPRYGEMAPMRSYMNLKITFNTRDKMVQNSFSDAFTSLVNDHIEHHDLPVGRQVVLLTPAGSGFTKKSALKTEIMLTAHLTDTEFKDFALAMQKLLQELPHVVAVRYEDFHHHVYITATGLESL